MSGHLRRAAAIEAIDAILAGKAPGQVETDLVDFKEEAGTVGPGGVRRSISPRHEPAAENIADEAACFANSTEGGILVVGVHDKTPGPAAFVGAQLDTVWLRTRIHALTTPPLSVDVIEELERAGQRIYLINIAPAMELVRSGNKLRRRIGNECKEVSGDAARDLLESHTRYDWSAQPSEWRFSQASAAALEIAATYYNQTHVRMAPPPTILARQLGLFIDADFDDPRFNNAGALLLCPTDRGWKHVDFLCTRIEGQASFGRYEREAPLLVAIDDIARELDRSFPSNPEIETFHRRERRDVPRRAYREAFFNAVMHRDYRHINGRLVLTAVGQPATMLRVESPGGFPPGVASDRLLATPSRPRNPVLANAMHTLGLAEREGIGVGTMYRLMLRDGHPAPEIAENGGDVLCVLRGGKPDIAVRTFFTSLFAKNETLEDDVRAHIAITRLLREAVLRPEQLMTSAQCTRSDALTSLEALHGAGALSRLSNRSQSFRLSEEARDQLRSRLEYTTRSAVDQHWDHVLAHFDEHTDIGRNDVVAILKLSPTAASRLLGTLANDLGRLEPTGKSRGRSVRYRLTESQPS